MDDDTDTFKQLVQGTAFVFVGNIVGLGATFLTRIIAANQLAPSGYGLVVLGASIINIVSIGVLLGLPAALGQRLPRVDDKPGLFRDTLLIAMPLATATALVLGLYADTVSALLNEPGFTPVLVVFAVSLPFFVLMKLVVAGFRGLESALGRVVVQNLGHQGLKAVGVIGFALLGLGPLVIAIGWAGAFVLAGLSGLVYLHIRTNLVAGARWRVRPDPVRTRSILSFSLPLVLSSGVVLMLQYGDNFLLAYFRNSNAVGIYDAAYTLGRTLLIFLATFKFLFVPMISRLHEAEDRSEMGQLYRLVTKWVVFVTFPVFFVFVLFPTTSLELLFRTEYTVGSTALVVLSIGFFVHILMGLNAGALVAMGYSKAILYGNIMSFGSNVALNLVLIPEFGLVGAALASAGSYTVMNGFYQYNLVRFGRINPFPKSVLLPLGSSFVLFGIPSVMYGSVISSTLPRFFGFISFFGVLYLGLIVTFGFDADDIDFILSAVDQTPIPTAPVRSILEALNRK
ncbi:flippase [Halorientalis litorea]|uniref:flippase n=1 Tax=Halorientalis litorea TaxID=2931977 RepID=UPI001FF0E488|nr:flippase [Halorientalis litorea]